MYYINDQTWSLNVTQSPIKFKPITTYFLQIHTCNLLEILIVCARIRRCHCAGSYRQFTRSFISRALNRSLWMWPSIDVANLWGQSIDKKRDHQSLSLSLSHSLSLSLSLYLSIYLSVFFLFWSWTMYSHVWRVFPFVLLVTLGIAAFTTDNDRSIDHDRRRSPLTIPTYHDLTVSSEPSRLRPLFRIYSLWANDHRWMRARACV